MKLLLYLCKGFLVGFAGLLPGMSGSAFLVLFGMYQPLTAMLAHPFRNLRQNIRLYGPFFAAALAGLFIGSYGLSELFETYQIPLLHLFTGLMLGAVPALYVQTRRCRHGLGSWMVFALFFFFCLALAFWEAHMGDEVELPTTWWTWFGTGASLGLCSLLPGANVAFLYIHFGIYQPLLEGVSHFHLSVLAPLVIGAAAAVLLFAKVVNWLFRVAEGPTGFAVLGLIAGSIPILYPGPTATLQMPVVNVLALLLGAGVSFGLNKLSVPKSAECPMAAAARASQPDE